MMSKLFTAFFCGGAFGLGSGFIYQNLNPPDPISRLNKNSLAQYVSKRNLEISPKVSLLKGYKMQSKSFLDFGLLAKLDGFEFYQNYFQSDELASDKINHIYCIFSPKQQVCGHPNILHGGVTATIMDQTTGLLAMLHARNIVATAELSCKYLKPIKNGGVYILQGQVKQRDGRKVFVNSKIIDLANNQIMYEGNTLFKTVQWDHGMAAVFNFLMGNKNLNEAQNKKFGQAMQQLTKKMIEQSGQLKQKATQKVQ